MTEFLNKLTSYHIFNFLLPGTLFAFLVKEITSYSFDSKDLLLNLFTYYFIGMVISRVGSLIVEPILKKIAFIKYADYSMYVSAEREDPKIQILLETNNTYRTMIGMLLCVAVMKLYFNLALHFNFLRDFRISILLALLFLVFLVSYKKQTAYIKQRVEVGIKQS